MKHITDFITFLFVPLTFLSVKKSKKVSNLLIIICCAFTVSCMGSLKKYKKEPCKKLPGDKVVTALKDNCMSCHKNDFNTKEDICSRKALIIDAVLKGRMPKIGKLYPHYRETLVKWK